MNGIAWDPPGAAAGAASVAGGPVMVRVLDPFMPSTAGSGQVSRQRRFRASVLATARQMLAANMDHRFTIARLADTLHTTPQTIHNNFGTRDDLMICAVVDHYNLIQRQAVELFDSPLFCFAVAQAYVDCAASTPTYVRAVARNSFECDPRTYGHSRTSSVSVKLPVLQRLSQQGWFRKTVDPLTLSKQIVRHNTLICYEWAVGQCDLVDLRRQLIGGMAMLLLGALRKEHCKQIEGWLTCGQDFHDCHQ